MKLAVALLCALCGAAYAGSAYTPAPSAGGASYAPADPMQAGSVTTWSLTDWTDAGSIGGATTVKRALLASGGVAGAGLAGLRSHMWTESAANTYTVTCTLHTATTSATLPWEA